jgi:hypothetical protein
MVGPDEGANVVGSKVDGAVGLDDGWRVVGTDVVGVEGLVDGARVVGTVGLEDGDNVEG